MMTAMLLHDLPIELISVILEQVEHSDWLTAMLTSRLWLSLGRRVFVSHLMTKMLSTSWATRTVWTRMGGHDMGDLTTSATGMLARLLSIADG
jgi:hypothetical protein